MYFFLIGLMLSYFYSKFILPSNTGNKPFISPTIYPILYQGMMIIPFNNRITENYYRILSRIIYTRT